MSYIKTNSPPRKEKESFKSQLRFYKQERDKLEKIDEIKSHLQTVLYSVEKAENLSASSSSSVTITETEQEKGS